MKKIVLSIFIAFICVYPLQASDMIFSEKGSIVIETDNHSIQNKKNNVSKALDLVRSVGSSTSLNNIRDIRLDGVFVHTSDNKISLENLRILSDTTDLNDYISLDYLIDAKSFQLVPTNLEIKQDIGVYYQPVCLFSKDVKETVDFISPNGEFYDTTNIFAINDAKKDDTYIMKVEAGMVLVICVTTPSDDMTIRIEEPDGNIFKMIDVRKGQALNITAQIPIFKSGEYACNFIPQNMENVSFNIAIGNSNCNSTVNISSGHTISGLLGKAGTEYAKYHLFLKNGQYLKSSGLTSLNISYYLIDSNSSAIVVGKGNIYAKINSTDDYYLFILNDFVIDQSVNYNCSIEISNDPNIEKYPILTKMINHSTDINKPFSLKLTASSKSTIQYYLSGIPSGLNLNKNTGLISGTPTVAGIFPIRVFVENEYGTDQDDFLLTVKGNNGTNVTDTDQDGVIDSIDLCNNTPLNSCVNNEGCSCEPALLDESGFVSNKKWRNYVVKVDKVYKNIDAELYNLENDLDLYVKKGEKPDLNTFDCRPYKGGKRVESCNLANDDDNIWYLGIYGYSEGNFSVKVTAKIY